MALDEALAVSVRKSSSPPVLRIYGWSAPSLTLGTFQKSDGINLSFCRTNNISVVRRLTGGRAVLHYDELTYSLSARNECGFSGKLMDVYMKIGAAFQLFFNKLGLDCQIKDETAGGIQPDRTPICFKSASTGEISHTGHKLIGSAQKRWNDAFLQQGSIPFSVDHNMLCGIFGTYSRNIAGLNKFIPGLNNVNLKKFLVASFEETFNVSLAASVPSQAELHLAEHLASGKYPDLSAAPAGTVDNRSGNNTGKESLP